MVVYGFPKTKIFHVGFDVLVKCAGGVLTKECYIGDGRGGIEIHGADSFKKTGFLVRWVWLVRHFWMLSDLPTR